VVVPSIVVRVSFGSQGDHRDPSSEANAGRAPASQLRSEHCSCLYPCGGGLREILPPFARSPRPRTYSRVPGSPVSRLQSAANASGSLQTTLSKLPRPPGLRTPTHFCRRGSPDRDLSLVSTNPTDQPITSGLPSLGRRASFVWREIGEVPKCKPVVRHGSAEQAMRKIVCGRRETPKIPARFFAMKLLEADIDRALGSAV
jgi:hypothetical protein